MHKVFLTLILLYPKGKSESLKNYVNCSDLYKA